MRFALDKLGSAGLVRDSLPEVLSPSVITDAKNVRFVENAVESLEGFSTLFPEYLGVEFLDDTHWVETTLYQGQRFFFLVGTVSGEFKAFVVNYKGVFTDATPELWGITPPSVDEVSGGVFDGIPIFCGGRGCGVFYITPPFFGKKFLPLKYDPNTNLQNVLRFNVVRPLWQQLIGLGVEVLPNQLDSIGKGYYPRLLWTSDFADPGFVPGSWEASDPTVAARSFPDPFSGYSGDLVDLAPLGNYAVAYQEDSCHLVQFTGTAPNFIVLQPALFNVGALSTSCVTALHNPQQVQSIVEGRMRKWLFSNIDPSNAGRCFTVADYRNKELMVCFPEKGETLPNLALVWNAQYNTVTVRDIPKRTRHAIELRANFRSVEAEPKQDTIVFGIAQPQNFLVELGKDYTQKDYYFEKIGIKPQGDSSIRKLFTRVWPEIDSQGEAVEITVGVHDRVDDPVRWGESSAFIPQRDASLPVLMQGRLVAIKIRWCAEVRVRVNKLEFEFETVGQF